MRTNPIILTPKQIRKFWEKVDQTSSPHGCWLWTGAKTERGYGLARTSGTRANSNRAHRVSWVLAYGQIPDGMLVCHNCPGGDNPSCVNPDHLFLGTSLDNNRDMLAKGTRAVGDRSGSRLHPERLKRGDDHYLRKHPELAPRGEKHGRAKLTWPIVRAIRARFSAGERLDQLAAEYGIARSTVGRIVRYERWREPDRDEGRKIA